MAYWIDYFRGAEKVMAQPCPKPLEEAKVAALEGLFRYDVDRAVVRDGAEEMAVVTRDA